MSYPTEKQVSYAKHLAHKAGFESAVAAVDAYGFGIKSVSSLTGREVSQLIEWLKDGGAPVIHTAPAFADMSRATHPKFGELLIINAMADGRVVVKDATGYVAVLDASTLTAI